MDHSQLWKITAITAIAIVAGGIAYVMASKRNLFLKPVKQKKHIRKRDIDSLKNSTEWEKVGTLKNIWIYPIKSCAGIPAPEVVVEKNGPMLGQCRDRSFVIVDTKNEMVTGRKINSTVLLSTSYDSSSDKITLSFPNLQPIHLYLSMIEVEGTRVSTKIWDDTVSGFDCGDAAADWLNLALGRKCRLLYHGRPDLSLRKTEKCIDKFPMFNFDDNGLYADLTSLMLMNEESIAALQRQTNKKHFPQNFRPNFLVSGARPFDEDDWTYLKIGECIFRNVKPCDRCIFTTVDYQTGKRDSKMEPLKTLRKYRLPEGGDAPHFGIGLGVDKVGKVKEGDDVYVLKT